MPPPTQGASASKPTPPPEGVKLRVAEPFKGKASASGPRSLVLHTGPAAVVAGERATGLLGRITELKREGKELGHLLDYAEKWNQADVSAATRGVGKDRLPVIDPAGPRSTEEHFMRLKRSEGSTADARKQLFEELLWEHRDLAETHSHCQAIREASIEALKIQLKRSSSSGTTRRPWTPSKLPPGSSRSKLCKLRAKGRAGGGKEGAESSGAPEEEKKARKAAERHIELMTTDHKEYDRLVMQIDALALKHFPDSQPHALKKVMEDRVAREFPNMDAHWDGYEYLVALSARVQHMRSVDRHLADLPDVAILLFKVLWPEEAMPANITLTANRLKEAGRRIREWQCSAARAGAD
ncbi:hypothetical protein QYE76_004794 [Lolium multiflorum]|uniref:Uncharacterized protein n=1 Tax=Lolium multiflorum TaxID=4521 RepID=A0AAD8RTH8_LOLMU|nr:hypothetical protein QYE76_004794 [Lolium multiflorum]